MPNTPMTIFPTNGAAMQVAICPRCERPQIGEEDRVRLLAGKVDLGRCQCPRGVSR